MRQLIAVFGIPGVGKTTMLRKAAKAIVAEHIAASDLLRQGLADRGDLMSRTAGAFEEKQHIIIDLLREQRARSGIPILLDGHSAVEADTGFYVVPNWVIEGIAPMAMICITAEPEVIFNQRMSDAAKQRPFKAIHQLKQYQDAAIDACRGYSHDLRLPLAFVNSGCQRGLEDNLRSILQRGAV